MADDDLTGNAKLLQEARETETERLGAHEVDLLLEQPARVVFAKACRFNHRLRFKRISVGGEFGLRFREHGWPSAMGTAGAPIRRTLSRGLRGHEWPRQLRLAPWRPSRRLAPVLTLRRVSL